MSVCVTRERGGGGKGGRESERERDRKGGREGERERKRILAEVAATGQSQGLSAPVGSLQKEERRKTIAITNQGRKKKEKKEDKQNSPTTQ